MTPSADEGWMRLAIDQAQNARLVGEVPVGAVIVQPGPDGAMQVLATGYNRPITESDRLCKTCNDRGIVAERAYMKREITF